jgi:hypothetical protein
MDFFRNEFEVYPIEPSGLHYILPPRDLGRLRTFGYVFVAVGIVLTIASVFLYVHSFFQPARNIPGWFEFLSSLKGWLNIIGVLAFTGGWLVLFGHSEIKLQNGKLRAIERAGFLRWRYKENASKVKVLELFDRNFSIYGVPVFAASNSDLCVVRAGKMNLAPGYPYETCVILAEHLQDHWAAALGLKPPATVPHVIDGTRHAGTEDDVWPDEFIVQPESSPILLTDSAEHLTLRIPPRGFKRDTIITLACSSLWLLFTAILTGFAIAKGAFRGPDAVTLGTFLGIFWIVAIGWLLHTINTMRHHAAIVVAGSRLMILTKNIFFRKRQEWRRAEVRAVVAASANPGKDHKPRIELQIRTVNDKSTSFFTGRPADELDWLAAAIRRKLFVITQSEVPAEVPAEEPQPQPRRVLEPLADR